MKKVLIVTYSIVLMTFSFQKAHTQSQTEELLLLNATDPLILAVRFNDVDTVRRTLPYLSVSDVNAYGSGFNTNAWTALHWAVLNENEVIADMLLEAGADPNTLFNRRTPLTLAFLENEALTNRLLETGVVNESHDTEDDINKMHAIFSRLTSDQLNFHSLCRRYTHDDICSTENLESVDNLTMAILESILDAGADPNRLLLSAVDDNSPNAVDRLLDAGANPNHPPSYEAPLATALRQGYFHLAEKLLKADADPNILSDGETLLGIVVRNGNIDIVDKLLEAGATPTIYHYREALHHNNEAIANRVLEPMLEPMLETALDPNTPDREKTQFFFFAIENFTPETIDRLEVFDRLLEEAEVDINASYIGLTPIQFAILHRRPGIVDRLLEAGATTPTIYHYLEAHRHNNEDMANRVSEAILERALDPNTPDREKTQFLFFAIENLAPETLDRLEVFDRLVEDGIDINASNNNAFGLTPVQFAILHRKSRIVYRLLDAGAYARRYDSEMASDYGERRTAQTLSRLLSPSGDFPLILH